MRCPNCQGEMIPLFTSCVCDRCDGQLDSAQLDRGFIVWRGVVRNEGRSVYVFRTREVAERWQRVNGLEDHEIREVLSEQKIRWHMGRGTLKDLELADQLYEVYPDHRHEPGPNRVFLAPAAARVA